MYYRSCDPQVLDCITCILAQRGRRAPLADARQVLPQLPQVEAQAMLSPAVHQAPIPCQALLHSRNRPCQIHGEEWRTDGVGLKLIWCPHTVSGPPAQQKQALSG